MNDIVKASEISNYFRPEHLDQMLKMAEKFYKAGCFGGGIKNAEQMLVMMQAGFEMGIPPVEAMNSLYIVNGKITIYGSAMSKRLRLRGWNIKYEDEGMGNSASCTVTIENKEGESHTYTATASELEKLNSKAFKFAPKEKLRWHALSRLIRFEVPEILDAGIAYLQEEMIDIPKTHQRASIEVQDVGQVDDTSSTPIASETKPNESTQGTPHLLSLKQELKNRGATDLPSALKILNEATGGNLEHFDMEESTASELLIRLLQGPSSVPSANELKQIPVEEATKKEVEKFENDLEKTIAMRENGVAPVPYTIPSSFYTDIDKVKKTIEKLDTVHEVNGIQEDINASFNEGDITESVRTILTELCARRMSAINDGLVAPKKQKKVKGTIQ